MQNFLFAPAARRKMIKFSVQMILPPPLEKFLWSPMVQSFLDLVQNR